MSASTDYGIPDDKGWNRILEGIDRGEFKDKVIYRLGQNVFSTYSGTNLPQSAELITRDRIWEILHPELLVTSNSFDPILASKTRREQLIGVGWASEFKIFERDLDELLTVTTSSNFKDQISQFLILYQKKYGVVHTDFGPLFSNQASLPYVREKLLNRVFNTFFNKQQIEDFLQRNKKRIIEEFGTKEHQLSSPNEFTFEIELTGKETHDKGKLPAKVVFSLQGKKAFTVMYKPRSAVLDKAIQELFIELEMPHYKIVSFPEENKSIWEYIDGEDMLLPNDERRSLGVVDEKLKGEGARRTPEVFIRYSQTIQKSEQIDLFLKLERLHKVLVAIESTDLHSENVRLGKDRNIYPIDLEVMDPRQLTMLMVDDYFRDAADYRATNWKKLTSIEQAAIKKWQERVNPNRLLSVRHVLVNTGQLVLLNYYDNTRDAAVEMAKLIEKALNSRGYVTSENQKIIIRNQVYIDLLNGDVPYFTELENIVYYGYPKEGYKIGRKEKE